MTIEQLTEFFKWMTIINLGLFLLSFLVTSILRNTITNLHAKIFAVEAGRVSEILYILFGFYKVMIIVFCFVPFVALLMLQ